MLKNIIFSFLIGTYGTNIYTVNLDTATGAMTVQDKYTATNSSYAIAAGDAIYTFSESGADSKVYSFKNGVRTEVPCPGDNPCFITISPDRKYIMTADYSGGSVSVYPLQNGTVEMQNIEVEIQGGPAGSGTTGMQNGTVGERIQKLAFEGSGPVTHRQGSPHIHQVKILPDIPGVEGNWILAPDLGSDKIRILRYNGNNGARDNDARENNGAVGNPAPLEHISDIQFPEGSGPRHIEFDVQRKMMYCIAELSGKVFAFRMGASEGKPAFELVQSVVADEYNTGGSGDIHLHPQGKYLYTSHRLQNDGLAVFAVNEDGTIEKKGYMHTKEHPRNFLITPCGKYLIVASKNTCTLQLFTIGQDGIPVATDQVLNLSPDAPTSVVLR